jgi:hypothetical protein
MSKIENSESKYIEELVNQFKYSSEKSKINK